MEASSMMKVSFDLDEQDCRFIERSDPAAREILRSSISRGASRRVIVETRVAEAWRDRFKEAGCTRAVDAIESRLPQSGTWR
ncbi:MAG: hypothetical protein C5B48_07575 [Candidatus Rokuibacteriota bacterium]|nr:MAG: hypothetical protein C5B48_07575 [Candidatus Rokubacteria bacterium]